MIPYSRIQVQNIILTDDEMDFPKITKLPQDQIVQNKIHRLVGSQYQYPLSLQLTHSEHEHLRQQSLTLLRH